jgi:hypothetical protein
MVSLNSLKRLHKPMSLLGVGGLAAMASVAMGVVQPAQAASCQAINSTSILSGVIPSPGCYDAVNVGDSFAIDFTNLFNSNPSAFEVTNTFSLQLANIGNGVLNFEDVALEITGNYSNATGSGTFNTLTPISIWTNTNASNPAFRPTGQGFTNYVPQGSGSTFFPGGPTAFNAANFDLTSPQAFPNQFNTPAGLINTAAIRLTNVGVESFTSARIVGKLTGASNPASIAFSAGLGIFTTNSPSSGVPNLVYGNAFNAVPGPLPVVGAGAAFGWSRKLRRRIGATKKAVA